MHCDSCDRKIDPETDRHLVVSERLVAPDWGVEGSDGAAYCADCMGPQMATLAPR